MNNNGEYNFCHTYLTMKQFGVVVVHEPDVQDGGSGRVNIVQGPEKFSRQNVELQQLTFGEADQEAGRTLGDAVGAVEGLKPVKPYFKDQLQ